MNLTDMILKAKKPALYEKGSSFMWTDEHISKQLLEIHLNPEVDLASRKMTTIIKTANWILDSIKEKGKLKILDLGCGPGLYSEIFAQNGHDVTGVDISKTSIDYAKKSARAKKLDITYKNTNYLNLNLETHTYDLVTLIFTDLGVLVPEDREKLLNEVFRVLKKGGLFIFDVLKDKNLESKTTPKTWEANHTGFWKETPYLALSESFLYKDQKVILYQHLICDSNEQVDIYRFWTHFFPQEDVRKMLASHKFIDSQFREDILPDGDMWNGDNVIFTITSK